VYVPLKQFPDGSSSIPPGSQFFSFYWTIPNVLLISPLWRQQWDFSTEIASPIGLHISLPVVKKSAVSSNVNPIHQGCPMLKHWMFKPGILQRCCQKLPTSRRYLLFNPFGKRWKTVFLCIVLLQRYCISPANDSLKHNANFININHRWSNINGPGEGIAPWSGRSGP